MKNIALGQYYPSDSHIHRLDGRIKLILSILFIVCTFLCKSAVSFVFLLVGTAALVCIAKIPLGGVLRSVRGIIFILIFTFCINMFFTKGEGAPLFEWRFIVLYREANEERIAEKKKKRGSGNSKATAKKKVKIKGKRQRQREKEAKNPYAKYDRPKYYGR